MNTLKNQINKQAESGNHVFVRTKWSLLLLAILACGFNSAAQRKVNYYKKKSPQSDQNNILSVRPMASTILQGVNIQYERLFVDGQFGAFVGGEYNTVTETPRFATGLKFYPFKQRFKASPYVGLDYSSAPYANINWGFMEASSREESKKLNENTYNGIVGLNLLCNDHLTVGANLKFGYSETRLRKIYLNDFPEFSIGWKF